MLCAHRLDRWADDTASLQIAEVFGNFTGPLGGQGNQAEFGLRTVHQFFDCRRHHGIFRRGGHKTPWGVVWRDQDEGVWDL